MTDSYRSKVIGGSDGSTRSRIALFGPIRPYRGGIAQYTTQLKRSLGNISNLQTISFERQYPKWLYPGESDKELGDGDQRESDVDYVLDALSPRSWHSAANAVIAKGCDHAILTWWTLFWAPAFAYIAWRLRRHGIRASFLCHNLFDHGARGIKQWLSRRLLSCADSYIVHSREQNAILHALFPHKPVLQRLLPIFDQFPPASVILPKRGRLEVLFFGFIRPYKGMDVLLDAISSLSDPEIYLTIVGESWDDKTRISEATRKTGSHVEAHLHYVDDQVAANYFERTDIVVLPYLSATGSAVVTLAYHYRKPVLASCVGGLEDAVIPGKTGWLVAPGSADLLASALASIDRTAAADFKEGIEMFIKENGWDAMAAAICAFHPASPTELRKQDKCS